ncbi:MAG: YjjG family noncanonical pyrimidine nucleotidase [Oscillospiraceae bacterium]|nr:YjjG family noncanonical pyrimidine nucleotidase [Oscillospiraceae bacterium]
MAKDKRAVVLLDLDDTILDFGIAEHEALKKTMGDLQLDNSEAVLKRYSEINKMHWEMLERGEITRPQVLLGRFEMLLKELGKEDEDSVLAAKLRDNYEYNLSQGHWFMPGAEQMLEDLDGKYRLFLCSNGTPVVQEGRLKSSGIGHYFEKVFISEQIGYNKPAKEYFDRCFEEIPELELSRCIIIGDSLSSDIQGGINAGIRSCWYNPRFAENKKGIEPDYEIFDLKQIAVLLENIFG